MASKRVAGTAYFKVDGEQLSLGGSMSVSPNTASRESVVGLSGPVGFKESQRAPYIEGEFVMDSTMSLKDIEDMKDVVITAELANGKVYTLHDAFFAGDIEADAAEGTVPLRFEGTRCDES